MDERRAEKAIKALNKAGAINVGTAEGTPVSREHAKEIVQAIRKQKRDELAVDDIVIRLRQRHCSHGNNYNGAYQPIEWSSTCERCELDNEAANEIERLRERVTQLETERDMWESHAQRSS